MIASCGTAFWNCESVTMISRASTCAASMPRSRKAAATMRLEMRSPKLTIRSEMRGVSSRMAASPRRISSSESNFWSIRFCSAAASAGILDQRGGGVAMPRAQPRTDGQRAGAVAVRGGRSGAQQLVGHLGHGAHHHHGLLALGHASGDDGRGAPDGRRILHRRAAELHHYQAHANLPRVAIVSSASSLHVRVQHCICSRQAAISSQS